MVSLWQIVMQIHNLAGPLVMLVYPLYASVQAIESPFKEDDTQWLTYWVLYSFLQLIELGFERVLAWIPLWYTFKLLSICWLVLPQFHGAAFLYENYVKKYIGGANATKTEKLSPKQRQLIEQMSPQARASVSAFISEYGPNAFDTVIHSVWSLIPALNWLSCMQAFGFIESEARRQTKSPSSAGRHRGSPLAAQPTRYPGTPNGAEPTRYTGSPPNARPPQDTGSPPSRVRTGASRADSFREYCRQPVKLLKTGLHSMESRRTELRAKMKTHFVT